MQSVDGVDGARLAVREQVGHGADWIKYYSDRRYYFTPDAVLRSWVNFTDDEAKAIVDEAHRLGRQVAAHAIGRGRHRGGAAGRRELDRARRRHDRLADGRHGAPEGVYWVPDRHRGRLRGRAPRGGIWKPMVEHQRAAFGARGPARASRSSMGTDAGGFPWTEINQAKEFEYYVQYGMTPMQAIKSGDVARRRAARAAGHFGAVAPGQFADIVAVAGDPLGDIRNCSG